MKMAMLVPARLLLEDGNEFSGYSFGAPVSAAGEVVFNTAMTGYPESLTDPSYRGQLLVSTYPLIGNYGVPHAKYVNKLLEHFESDKVQISGLVISDYSFQYSHWNAAQSLADWLTDNNIPGIFGVDTRAITKTIRERGAMPGKIIIDNDIDFYDPNKDNLVAQVSPKEVRTYGKGTKKVLLYDCGTKNNIIRCLLRRNTTVIRVPWDQGLENLEFDGVVLSNGPGDPKMCQETISTVKKLIEGEKPVFGICLGSQIMALAAGAETYKLKYGHRSHNQPVIDKETGRCFITSQNHGYAVDNDSIGEEWLPWFINLNDQTNEGIRHKDKPFFAVQFHPEASAGPVDTEYLFDDFIASMDSSN
jgi:carbamoyl-phosphate synthase small subunit